MRNASNAFIFVFLLLICTFIFKKLLQMFPQSKILICVVSVAAQLKWGWDCLLLQSSCQFPNVVTRIMSPENGASEVGVRAFEGLVWIGGWALGASLVRSAELTSSHPLGVSKMIFIIIKRLSSSISALIVEIIDAHGG
nr:E3 ubiquitin-protein ligase RHA2B-like [Ipomoea batatas]